MMRSHYSFHISAARGGAEQNVSLLHLDQRGEDRHAGTGGTTPEQGAQEPRGEIHRDGRRCGQHIFRQHEGTVYLQTLGTMTHQGFTDPESLC